VRAVYGQERAFWLLKTYTSRLLARIMGVPTGYRTTGDDQRFVDDLQDYLFPIKAKKAGVIFDALVSNRAVNEYPLEALRVPTLIIHSADDPLSGYKHTVKAAPRIPGARFITIDRGGHLFLGHDAEVCKETTAFIRDVVPGFC
jgi:pimeloyl-ACP methyl ester carboxylesterase